MPHLLLSKVFTDLALSQKFSFIQVRVGQLRSASLSPEGAALRRAERRCAEREMTRA